VKGLDWRSALHEDVYPKGQAQGYFLYFKDDGTFEEILAISGKLYKAGVELPITGLASFQTERQIEAVQFQGKLYVATGTKIVEYDGAVAKVIEPYKPDPLEALYIGTSALADNPDQFLTDGTSAMLQVTGITVDKRYGVVNKPTLFTAFVAKPITGIVEYKWDWRIAGTETWKDMNNVTGFSPDRKQVSASFWTTTTFEVRCRARMQGTTEEVEYQIPQYKITATDENKTVDLSTIHTCNRILVHWQRMIIYGDTGHPDMIYISDLDRPSYFPSLSNRKFENTRQEGLTALVKFRDMLVGFTPNTITAMFGKSPEDYSWSLLSSSIGCIAPYSAEVMENYITFLSQEGVYILKTLGYNEGMANVQKIDNPIGDIVPRHTDACAVVADGQYQITFPQSKIRLRYYYNQGIWTKDESEKLTFLRNYEWGGEVYVQMQDGLVLKNGSMYHDDGHVYVDKYVFKDYDFGEAYTIKKLKEMQLVIGNNNQDLKLAVRVHVDGVPILDTDRSYAMVNDLGEAIWVDYDVTNLELMAGTAFGSWSLGHSPFGGVESTLSKIRLTGKGRRVRLEINHTESKANHVLGVGFIFKSKSP
jgi:hypothetical protein